MSAPSWRQKQLLPSAFDPELQAVRRLFLGGLLLARRAAGSKGKA